MPVSVPGIIPRELFSKVQEQLKKNKKFAPRNNNKNQYLLGGVVHCPCGYVRTGDPANKNNRYYRCNDRLNNVKGTRKCFEKGINVPVLDDLVWTNVSRLLKQPELVFHQAKRWQDRRLSPLKEDLTRLKSNLNKLEEKHSRFLSLFGEGEITEHEYKERKYEISSQSETIVDEISAIEDEIANKPSVKLEELSGSAIKLIDDLEFSEKKKIIQRVVTKIVATKQEVSVRGYIPVLTSDKIEQYEKDNIASPNKSSASLLEVGLNVKNRYRRSAQRRQIHPLQRPY